ncbi:nitrate reductase molybdenum cofactor assembly chaperone [Cohnella fermenti]|uniref:nitrate reductase molybdenum cofactor assembly chaperone n=1 Tax=Cohnella fermenti TaxID=2565925 RepID=UPI001454D0C5|nr:nitrate reductase molybdenum cofactor assembly chaperone [Cohnella fermenti]
MDIATIQRLYGIVSVLLQYPDEEWRRRLSDLREEAEELADAEDRETITDFLDLAERTEEREWQDRYVRTFDFGKKSNLYATYSEHGEDRERGTALLSLKRLYQEAGFELETTELPDYLPLMLEFASAAPWGAAVGALSGVKPAIGSIHNELAGTNSPYAPPVGLLLRLVPDRPAEPEPAEASMGGGQR